MLRSRDLRGLDREELEVKLRELKEELFNVRFQHATGQLENPMKIKETRRDIARVYTLITEEEFGIHEQFEEAWESTETIEDTSKSAPETKGEPFDGEVGEE